MATLVVNQKQGDMTRMLLPGLVTVTLHFMAMALTADSIVTEKENGLIYRGIACGVKIWQMLLAQIIVQLIPLTIQLILCLAFSIIFLQGYLIPSGN